MNSNDVEFRLMRALSQHPAVVPFDSPIHAVRLIQVFKDAELPRVVSHLQTIFWREREGVREATMRLTRPDGTAPTLLPPTGRR